MNSAWNVTTSGKNSKSLICSNPNKCCIVTSAKTRDLWLKTRSNTIKLSTIYFLELWRIKESPNVQNAKPNSRRETTLQSILSKTIMMTTSKKVNLLGFILGFTFGSKLRLKFSLNSGPNSVSIHTEFKHKSGQILVKLRSNLGLTQVKLNSYWSKFHAHF